MQLVTDLANRIVVSRRRFGSRSPGSIGIAHTYAVRSAAAENRAAVR
jgi:hypothetical protein